jgi:hypothetical protein
VDKKAIQPRLFVMMSEPAKRRNSMKLNRYLLTGIATLALGAFLVVIGTSLAGEDKLGKQIDAIADAVGKGDAKVKDMASKVAKDQDGEVYDIMMLMKPRKMGKKSGLGVGTPEDGIVPDGIELKIRDMSRDVISGAKLKKEGEAISQMAHRVAAIAEITKQLSPKKDKKLWDEFTESMRESADELAKAVKDNSPAEVKTAASKLNASCNNCHSKFR